MFGTILLLFYMISGSDHNLSLLAVSVVLISFCIAAFVLATSPFLLKLRFASLLARVLWVVRLALGLFGALLSFLHGMLRSVYLLASAHFPVDCFHLQIGRISFLDLSAAFCEIGRVV